MNPRSITKEIILSVYINNITSYFCFQAPDLTFEPDFFQRIAIVSVEAKNDSAGKRQLAG